MFLSFLLIVGSYAAMAQEELPPAGGGGGEDCYKYVKGKRVDDPDNNNIYCFPPYSQTCFVIVVPCPNPARVSSLDESTTLRLPLPDNKNFVEIPIKSNYKIETLSNGATKLSYELE